MTNPRCAPFLLLSATCALLGMPSPAAAQTLAADVVDPDAFRINFAGTYGWSFTLAAPTRVTALGVYDSNSDGLTNNHPVGLWKSDGTLLTSATVPNGTTGFAVPAVSGVGSYRFLSVSPLTLGAGDYVIGAFYPVQPFSETPDFVLGFSSAVTTAAGLTYGTPRVGGPNLIFPNLAGGPRNGYFGPNLLIGPAASAPEPVSFALLLPIVFAAVASRRRRA